MGGARGGSNVPPDPPPVSLARPRGSNTLGTGTFGRVRLVYHRASNKTYALKILRKAHLVGLKQETNIINEKSLLLRIDHPFIIKLYDTFSDASKCGSPQFRARRVARRVAA